MSFGCSVTCRYEQPTAIQAQSLPAVLSGRDVLGIAKTGSGKTAAFVLPMMVHIMDQPELQPGEGPIGVVVAPTRELAEQIHKETRKFSKPYGEAEAVLQQHQAASKRHCDGCGSRLVVKLYACVRGSKEDYFCSGLHPALTSDWAWHIPVTVVSA